MSGRADRLNRLLAIRRLSEDLDRRALKVALASVAEVEAGLARQQAALLEARVSVRDALSAGDRGEWLMADAQSEVAKWNRARLRPVLGARTVVATAAMQTFLAARREHEQVKQLIDNAQRVARSEEDRKAQTAADDWFLGKRARPAE